MELKKFLFTLFLAFLCGGSIKYPQDSKFALAAPTDGMNTKFSGAAEKNSGSFIKGNVAFQAISKSGSSRYAARKGEARSWARSPILSSITHDKHFDDFAPLPLPSTVKTSNKETVLTPTQNEKTSLNKLESDQSNNDLNQNHHASKAVEKILDFAGRTERDDSSDNLNQFASEKGVLEKNVDLQSPINGRSRSSSISSVCSNVSLSWDNSEQEFRFFRGTFEKKAEKEFDFGTEPLFKDPVFSNVAPESFEDLDLTGTTPTEGGTSTHYMNWGTGDFSDSEDEKSSISRASLDWNDSEQELSFFKGTHEESDEEELDLGTETLFKDFIAPANLESSENLGIEEKFYLQRALRSAKSTAPDRYMILCYVDEENFQRTPARKHSIPHDFSPKIVSRQFTLRDPDFL